MRLRLITLLFVALALCVQAQEGPPSPSSVIESLTLQNGRKPGPIREFGVFSCGAYYQESRENRTLARELAGMGDASLPSLDAAFDSLEKGGLHSPFAENAVWMFYAYAKIKGVAAYPRLRKMVGDPGLASLRGGLDAAIALSLGLTSYVSSSRQVSGNILCSSEEPRDGLDQLVLAWERDNRRAFEARLGPAAKSALQSLLKGRDWVALRAEFWRRGQGRNVALGYQFSATGRWAEPAETLEQEQGGGGGGVLTVESSLSQPTEFQMDVRLESGSGATCGVHIVKFLRSAGAEASPGRYLIDNADLASLLRSISSCSA